MTALPRHAKETGKGFRIKDLYGIIPFGSFGSNNTRLFILHFNVYIRDFLDQNLDTNI
jgi:hypothetical protein